MNDQHGVSGAGSRRFVDPDQFQAAIRGGDNMYNLLGRGVFHAELTDIKVGQLLLQCGSETLPRLASTSMPPNRVGILGWFEGTQLPVVRGAQMRQGEFMSLGLGMQSHHRTFGRNDFAALTLDAADLTRAAMDLAGRELAVPVGKVLRPPDHLGTWLLSVIDAAKRAQRTTLGIFTSPAAAGALEQALLRPMIRCLLDGEARIEGVPRGHRAAIARRFAAAVEASLGHPLLILDLCRMVGITARTLNTLCQEQFGVSAQRFLAVRRLHLTRRALLRSDRLSTTVTEIATSHGIWELGRFAVAYKSLFGESPSATLRRLPQLS
jgi:AraC-like DNA-binding protein